MSDQSQISISIEKSIKSIGKKNWNKCANHDPLNYNPFVSFEFLNALEESKSVNGNSGWYTSYFVAKDIPHHFYGNTKNLSVLYFFGGPDS